MKLSTFKKATIFFISVMLAVTSISLATVSTTTNRVMYSGDGSTTVFTITFYYLDENDIKVYVVDADGDETLQTETAHYTITAGPSSTGSVTMLTAPTATEDLLIIRQVPYTQELDLVEGGPFLTDSVEQAWDKLTMAVQQLDEKADRSLTLPLGSTLSEVELPYPESEKVIGWNMAADGLQNVDIADGGDLTITDYGRTLVLSDDEAALKSFVNLEVGVDVQHHSSALDSLSTLTPDSLTTLDSLLALTPDSLTTLASLLALTQHSLTYLLHPNSYADIYKTGTYPSFFNQQWGGAFGGEYPGRSVVANGTETWFSTGYIQTSTDVVIGNAAAATWEGQQFKVPVAMDVEAVWIKIYKVGNPQKDTEPLVVYIYNDNSKPNALVTNATVANLNGHSMASDSVPWEITDNTDGEWVRLTFSTSPTLAANTKYHIVFKAAGADAANYFKIKCQNSSSNTYPHGNRWDGDDAVPSNWTEDTSLAFNFLIEAAGTDHLLQSGNQYTDAKKIVFQEGNPIDMSNALTVPLKNFYNEEQGTFRITTEAVAFTVSKTLLDINMGALDHDRIRLSTDASGYLTWELWESDGTKHTDTGTTATNTASVKDILVSFRCKADGSDYFKVRLNGATAAGITDTSSQTYTMSPDLANLGHMWLGSGFPTEPTWDEEEDMSALPSAGSWTYEDDNAAADEAKRFFVMDNLLYMQKAGLDANTDWHRYKYAAGLVNATGWRYDIRMKVNECVNTSLEAGMVFNVDDQTYRSEIIFHEHYIELAAGDRSSQLAVHQMDTTDRFHVYSFCGKGTDVYVFVDGKLAIDGTGLHTTATSANLVFFGDHDATASSNSDVVIDYVKGYDAGPLPPEVNSSTWSEFSAWSEDLTSIAATLYSSGTPTSTKDYAGVKKNYIERVKQQYSAKSSASVSVTSTDPIVLTGMEFYILTGGNIKLDAGTIAVQDTANNYAYMLPLINGAYDTTDWCYREQLNANDLFFLTKSWLKKVPLGLNHIALGVEVNATTATYQQREFIIEEK